MTPIQKKIILAGIQIKLDRGESLETILTSYTKLTVNDKQEIRIALEG